MELDIKNRLCESCNHIGFKLYGTAQEGRQRIICLNCKSRPTINLNGLGKRKRAFKKETLLPILQKEVFQLTKAELYCLGLLIADGCFLNTNTMVISVDIKDIKLLELLKKELHIPGSIRQYQRNKEFNGKDYLEKFVVISWQHKYSSEYWRKLGLFNQKTSNEIWLEHMNHPAFVRGLLDGDGCFHSNGLESRLSIVMGGVSFLESLQTYLETSLGIRKQIPHYSNERKTATALRYRIKEAVKIGDFIYQDSEGLRLERKYNKYLEIKAQAILTVDGPRKTSNSSSKYRGVDLYKPSGLWRARIRLDSGQQELIGFFDNEIEAATAYNNRAIELGRDFFLNEV